MGLQAGRRGLDLGRPGGIENRRYVRAIHSALGKDYAPMESVFRRMIERTLRR